MSKKKANAFTIQQLLDRGFTQRPDGSWGKGGSDPTPQDSRPSGGVVESGAGSEPSEKDLKKARRKRDAEEVHERFQLVIVSYRNRLIDNSNACIKYIEDAIVAAGFMPDDAPKYCPAPRFIQCKVRKKEERTEVYVFRITKAANHCQSSPSSQKT